MRYFRYFLAFTLAIVAFFAIYREFKGAHYDIPALFKEADKSLLIFLVLFQGLNYLGGGWLFQTLSAVAGYKVKLADTFKIAVLGVAGAHIAPFFGGSIATFLSFKKLKIPAEAISFLIPSWSFFIWLSYFLSFAVGLAMLPGLFSLFFSLKEIIIISAVAASVLAVCFVLFRKRGENLIKIIRFFHKNDLSEKFIGSFYQNIAFLPDNKRKIPQILLSSFFFYSGDILTLYFSFLVFGFHPNFIILILGYVFSLLLTLLAIMPGMPGVMEASLILVFVKLGLPAHIVLFSSVLFRLFTYWLPLPAGLYTYWRLKKQ